MCNGAEQGALPQSWPWVIPGVLGEDRELSCRSEQTVWGLVITDLLYVPGPVSCAL